jgi:hypothetical protein
MSAFEESLPQRVRLGWAQSGAAEFGRKRNGGFRAIGSESGLSPRPYENAMPKTGG